MEPKTNDPYVVSPAADADKKQTQREMGVPYLPIEEESGEDELKLDNKRKKALVIGVCILVAALFLYLGITVLSDPSAFRRIP